MSLHVTTTPHSLYQSWQFAIEINGFDVALFQKSSLPKTEFDEVNFAPAGSIFDEKVAGRMKFDNITMEKGMLADGSEDAARQWLLQVGNPTLGVGGIPEMYMREVDIVQYDRTGIETRRWHIHGAWIKSLDYDDMEGGKTDNIIEKLTLAYQYWS
jgi:phage tail-like protein